MGMTVKQLKTMLVFEGLFYSLGAALLALLGKILLLITYSFTAKNP